MTIQAEHIHAFIDSAKEVFECMTGAPLGVTAPRIRTESDTTEITCVIRLEGDLHGAASVGVDADSAWTIFQMMTGEAAPEDPGDVLDAMGELTNLIVGGAKTRFNLESVRMTCPDITQNQQHLSEIESETAIITIPCETQDARFQIDVAIEQAPMCQPAERN